ncbi:hypothetical protein ACFX2H_009392 [Malus domestica]
MKPALVAVLFQVSTASSEAIPVSVMRFFILGTYTDCPVFEVNEERREGEGNEERRKGGREKHRRKEEMEG